MMSGVDAQTHIIQSTLQVVRLVVKVRFWRLEVAG